jgi:hypothetical protein
LRFKDEIFLCVIVLVAGFLKTLVLFGCGYGSCGLAALALAMPTIMGGFATTFLFFVGLENMLAVWRVEGGS